MADTNNPNSSRLEYLLPLYLSNDLSEEEVLELFSLLKLDQNEKYLSGFMERNWEDYNPDKKILTSHAERLLESVREKIKAQQDTVPIYPKRNKTMLWKMAASLLLLAASSFMIFNYTRLHPTDIVVEAPPGKRLSLILPDSSQVWLNAGSKIVYPNRFPDNLRQVELVGEAFFEVVKNTNQPFVVKSKQADVIVLGTAFNIKSYGNEPYEVTVVTGKVQVETPDKNYVHLIRGQQISYENDKGFSAIKSVAPEKIASWKHGTLLFDDKKLSEVILCLERWYQKKFVLKNDKLNNCVLMGEHTNESLETVLNTLQFVMDIDYTITGDTVTIDGKDCPGTQPETNKP